MLQVLRIRRICTFHLNEAKILEGGISKTRVFLTHSPSGISIRDLFQDKKWKLDDQDVFSASRCHAGWVWWFLVLRHLRMLQEPLAASVARCSFEVCKNVKSAASVSVECLPDQKHDCFGWTSKDVATGSKQINTPPGSSWCSVIPAQRRLKAANYHNKSQPL